MKEQTLTSGRGADYTGKGCGKTNSKRCPQCYSSSLCLKDPTGVWTSFKKIQWSHHTTPLHRNILISLFSPDPRGLLVSWDYTSQKDYNSYKPHLNIIAFSGKSERGLIATWSRAQFHEVSVTHLGYSWHPSAAASILTQDSSRAPPQRRTAHLKKKKDLIRLNIEWVFPR